MTENYELLIRPNSRAYTKRTIYTVFRKKTATFLFVHNLEKGTSLNQNLDKIANETLIPTA